MMEEVYRFDFHASLSGHAAYVGATPEYILSVVDGFLSEVEYVPGGTMADLKKLRTELIERIAPAYQAGKSAAHEIWAATTSDEERDWLGFAVSPDDTMAVAWQHVPNGLTLTQANWFVEGFCHNWGQEWFDYQVAKAKREG
jgi:hypothetical protein